jgi:hypothetical protein
MDAVTQFLNDPLVAPLYGLLVVAVIGMLLGIYQSARQGAFDWKKLPGILDGTVLQKMIPLAALGIASFFVSDAASKTGMQVAYGGLVAAAYAAEIKSLIEKVTGGFVATNTAQDKGLAPMPEAKK